MTGVSNNRTFSIEAPIGRNVPISGHYHGRDWVAAFGIANEHPER
jgi:hypothetical protein